MITILTAISSCGIAPVLEAPGAPVASDPDPDNPNRIEIKWKAVARADIYYIYRSAAEDGSYTDAGFSVTPQVIENADGEDETWYSYIDSFDEGEGGTYWYKVSAASDIDTSVESPLSPAVSAATYEGTWGDAYALGAAAKLELAADFSALYVVYSAGTADTPINVKQYAEAEDSEEDEPPMVWSSLASPGNTNGLTDGSADGTLSVFIEGGELHTLFNDQTVTGEASLRYYHDSGTADAPSFAWETLGTAGFNTDTEAVTEVSAAAVGFGGTIYAAFIESGAGTLWKYNTTLEDWTQHAAAAPAEGALPAAAGTVQIVEYNNNMYYGYEDTTGGLENLQLRRYDDAEQKLQTVNSATTVTTSNIDDGNAVFVSGGGSLYAVYIDDSGFEVEQLADDVWAPLENTAGTPVSTSADSAYGSLDALWFNGRLYVFYINSADSNKGWVKYYDEDDGWKSAEKNGTAVTGSGTITALQLASSGSSLYAGYIEDGTAYVRILE